MDENKERNEDCPICHHRGMKAFLAGLMTFLGAFAAFYVVSDMRLHTLMNPEYQMRKFEKQMMKEHKRFDKAMNRDLKRGRMIEVEGNKIFHIIQTKDNYKIIVDLNAFDNDERNIETKIDGNTLTITGAGMKETSNTTKIAKFSQSYAFGDDVDLKDMTKMRRGDHYIITIPIED